MTDYILTLNTDGSMDEGAVQKQIDHWSDHYHGHWGQLTQSIPNSWTLSLEIGDFGPIMKGIENTIKQHNGFKNWSYKEDRE